MLDIKTFYTTPATLIGRHEWRIEILEIEGELKIVPTFRRVGLHNWQFPSAFGSPIPSGVLNYALLPGNILALATVLSDKVYMDRGRS